MQKDTKKNLVPETVPRVSAQPTTIVARIPLRTSRSHPEALEVLARLHGQP